MHARAGRAFVSIIMSLPQQASGMEYLAATSSRANLPGRLSRRAGPDALVQYYYPGVLQSLVSRQRHAVTERTETSVGPNIFLLARE